MNDMQLYPTLVSLLAGLVILLFFSLIKYRDSLNNNAPHQSLIGYVPLYEPIGYMSVGEFLSGGERRWIRYFIFRYTPHLVVLILLTAVLQRYYHVSSVLPYLVVATSVAVLPGSLVPSLKATFISEKLLHLCNTMVLYFLTVLIAVCAVAVDLAFIAPSVSGLFDNLWSSLLVATVVLMYAQAANPHSKNRDAQAQETAKENYVLKSYTVLLQQHGATIEKACADYACSKPILYAVLIYENINRPPLVRRMENMVVRITKKELTVGIAQVKSDKPLTDAESIEKAARILEGSTFADSGYGSGFVDIQQLEKILERYNDSALYAESVAEIMSVLRRYTSNVFPPAYGTAIGY